MRHWLAVALLLGSACPAAAQPFGASGYEFRVNTTTSGEQWFPAIAYEATQFLIVWSGSGPADDKGIFGQRYGIASPVGAEFLANTNTSSLHMFARVAGLPPGAVAGPQFVVVWESDGQDGDGYGVFGQRFDSSGFVGSEFQVNTHTTGWEYRPDVALDGNGDFVVVWEQPDGSNYGIFGRRYASTGAPQGSVFRVNTYTSSYQTRPSVSKGISGEFVVVWQSYKEFGTGVDIVGRRFSSAGAPLDDDFLVEATTTEPHGYPSVASVGVDAGFVVTWAALPSAMTRQIFARRFDASGAPLTGAFRVNTTTADDHDFPSVAADAGGDVTVVWQTQSQDGDQSGVFAQRYASSGAPAGAEFRVNTYTTDHQSFPRVAMQSTGWFTVAWMSNGQDGSMYGTFGRRFCALQGDANGDDAVTVGDVFYLINDLFAGGSPPVRPSDVNGDGVLNVNDVFYLINYIFAGGPAPGCVPLV